jgi:hypothetical protein
MSAILLLSATLAAAPVQVTISRSVDVKDSEAQAFLLRLGTALTDAGVGASEVLSAAVLKGCRGKAACIREAAQERGGHLLLDVELAWVAGQLGANLSALDPTEDAALHSHRFIVGGERYHLELDAELSRFSTELRRRLPPVLPWAPPRTVQLEPGPDAVAERPTGSPVLKRVATGAAVTSGVAAGVFAVLGVLARGELEGSYVDEPAGRRSTLDQRHAHALAETSNARFTGALVASGVALGLAVAAVLIPSGTSEE